MGLNLNVRQVGGIQVLDAAGRVTLGEGASVLRDHIKGLLGEGKKKILLNLAEVSFVDSSGIGELVSAYTSVSNQGGQLKLLNLTKRIRDLLVITKLISIFEIFDDEAAALASFN
jgi:anti-sigma B factor antagonist